MPEALAGVATWRAFAEREESDVGAGPSPARNSNLVFDRRPTSINLSPVTSSIGEICWPTLSRSVVGSLIMSARRRALPREQPDQRHCLRITVVVVVGERDYPADGLNREANKKIRKYGNYFPAGLFSVSASILTLRSGSVGRAVITRWNDDMYCMYPRIRPHPPLEDRPVYEYSGRNVRGLRAYVRT